MTALAMLAALTAAFGYGTANFVGGLASRRQHAAITLLLSQGTAFVMILGAAMLAGGVAGDMRLGAAAGTLGFGGAACAYLCFSLGRPVGVAAVLMGMMAATIPVAVGVLTGSRLGPVAMAGLVIAAGAVAILGWPDHATTDAQAALLAIAAGTMFGAYHAVMSHSPATSGMWPLVASQGVIVGLAVVASVVLRVRPWPAAAGRLSITDGAASTLATVAALLAVRSGSLPSVGMLIALAPAVTTLLAWIVLHERPHGRRAAGLALAVAAIACLTV